MTLQATQEATSSPSPAQPSEAEQLQSEFRDRVRSGLEKAGHRSAADEVRGSDVLDEEAPEKVAPKAPKDPKAASDKPAASTALAAGKTADKPEADTEPAARPQPRYDSKSFGKWIENNPDKAAELAAKVFKVQLGSNTEQWKKHFIAAENKRRRQNEADESERASIAKDRADVERIAKEASEPIEGIINLIEAEQKEDYPAIDRFIETTFKTSFDDYCRRRLRGMGKETVTERAQKQKIQALEQKLAEAAKPAETEAPEAKPAVIEKWLEREIGADHGVRDLADWKTKVAAAYEKSKDEDSGDYDLSIEEAAQQVLDAFLDKRAGKAPGKPASGRRAAPPPPPRRGKSWSDDDEDRTPARDADESESAPPNLDYAAVTRRALERAKQRAAR